MKSLSKNEKILFYFFFFLIVFWLIFDSLKFSWTDDTFQKVILAPLGEEPLKLLVGLLGCLGVYCGKYIRKTKQKINFIDDFYVYFVPFSILYAILFGLSEGPLANIVLHFSTTTMASISIIIIFQKIKDNSWKIYWKILVIFSSLIIPIILHSISNQYANLEYAISHPQFEYLVVVARFFDKHSFTFAHFITIIFVSACILLYIYSYDRIKMNRIKNHL